MLANYRVQKLDQVESKNMAAVSKLQGPTLCKYDTGEGHFITLSASHETQHLGV